MFTKIDMSTWDRAEYYNHFLNIVPCNYNLTVSLDITVLLKTVKSRGAKLYPSLIHILSLAVNTHKEFRMAISPEKEVGFYDVCHPSFTIPNALPCGFSGIWGYSCNDFATFFKNYIQDVQEYSSSKLYAPKANQPYNTFYVSCTPDIAFSALQLNLMDAKDCLTPMFTIGKYTVTADVVSLPLAMLCHHAAIDGGHVTAFIKTVQRLCDDAPNWLVL